MNIARIAKAADVSYATAWRVINNHPLAGENAIRAVRDAIHRHGYSARPLAGKKRGRPRKPFDGIRTHNLALLHLREGTLLSAAVIRSVQQCLAEKNLNLIFAHVERPDDLPQAVRTGNVDGILGYGQFPPELITPDLCRVPAVWMMSRSDPGLDPWGDRVHPHHQIVGEYAARLALRHHPDHVGMMNPKASYWINNVRCDAFRQTCEQAGARVDAFESTGVRDQDVQAQRLVEQFLAASPRPPVLFLTADQITIRVYRLLLANGIQPGRDVRLISCDNEAALLDLIHPKPTSIDLQRDEISRTAVDRLLWRMKHGLTAPQIIMNVAPALPVELESQAGVFPSS